MTYGFRIHALRVVVSRGLFGTDSLLNAGVLIFLEIRFNIGMLLFVFGTCNPSKHLRKNPIQRAKIQLLFHCTEIGHLFSFCSFYYRAFQSFMKGFSCGAVCSL